MGPALLLVLVATTPVAAEEGHLKLDPSRGDLVAVALSAADGSAAYATTSEVYRADQAQGPYERVFRGRGLRDLVFDDEGSLWMATERGVFLGRRGQAAVERSPGPGAARVAHRFARAVDGRLAVATARGVFIRDLAATSWRAVDGRTAVTEVTAIGFDRTGRLWWVSEGDLYESGSKSSSFNENDLSPRRSPVPGLRDPVVDLARAPEGSWVALTARGLLRRTGPGQGGGEGWEVFPLGLAPGASARRLTFTGRAVWLATDRGLARIPWGPDGPGRSGRLAAEPVGRALGSSPVNALAVRGEELLVAAARGLGHRLPGGGRRQVAPVAPAGGTSLGAADPSLREVQRATLRHLALDRGPLRSLAARARARGWLPEVELRGGYGGARSRELDVDETFSSGEPRLFTDHERRRSRDFDVFAVLRWDLGDTVYHPEELDIAKERREVIELRDEILDEVNQLYVERQRALLSLAALADLRSPEARRLALRADELGAGLDAWTGGWWGREVPPLFLPRIPKEPSS